MAAAFWEHPVTVEVPATSANLGPGFDSLGLALTLHDVVTVQVVSGGLQVQVEGEGAGAVPLDDSHLIVRTLHEAFAAMDAQPGGLLVHCRNAIPHARGLGSSSAAIVAGLWAARACVVDGDERLSNADLLRLATRIEGHPDNVAPCLLGGFTIAWTSGSAGDMVDAVSRPVATGLAVTAFVPAEPVSTEAARGLLPPSVPHADAAFNAARTALLVDALVVGADAPAVRAARLLEATDDRLHQAQRASAMPASADLVQRLRAAGVAACISGAGPTVLALTVEGPDTPALPTPTPAGFSRLDLAVDPRGVRVVSG